MPSARVRPAAATLRMLATARQGLVGATLGTVALNGVTTGLGFLLTVTLTHVLGVREYGNYSFAIACATIVTIPATLGLTPLVVRRVAAYHGRSAWGALRGIIRRSNQVVTAASFLVAAATAGVGWLLVEPDSGVLPPFWIGLLLVPLLSLITLRQAAMQGLGRVVVGRMPEAVVGPGIFLALLLGATVAVGGSYSASAAIALQVAATAVAFGLGAWLLRRALPTPVLVAPPTYETRAWLRSSLSLLAASIALGANGQIGTILVGTFKGNTEAGVFSATSRMAMFVSFLFLAGTYPLMPAVARLHAAGHMVELQRLMSRAARLVVLASLPVAVLFVALAPQLLDAFGSGFDAGTASLRILVAGEVMKLITGFGGLALLMTAHELEFARPAVGGTAINLAVGLALVPRLGAEGAAIATVLGATAFNVALVLAARRHLGIWPAVVGSPLRRAGGI